MNLYKLFGLSLALVSVYTIIALSMVGSAEVHTTVELTPMSPQQLIEPTLPTSKDNAPQASVEVKPGDTLTLIAQEYDVDYVRLFSANDHIEHPDLIEPGDEIRIPAEDEEITPRVIPVAVELEPVAEAAAAEPAAAVAAGSVWDQLAQCESGGRWDIDSTYDGGLQFHPDTWNRSKPAGYPAYAWQATREQQIEVGKIVQASGGWDQWPHCSSKLGLR